MNYWPAETTNLAELHEPLLDSSRDLAVDGREDGGRRTTARAAGPRITTPTSGGSRRRSATSAQGDPVWALWPMAGPWLAQHLWEHYAFGGDTDVSAGTRAYPLMKGAAEFCLDWLIEDEDGRLMTSPSTSPEHKFVLPDGRRAAVSAGGGDGSRVDLGSVHEHASKPPTRSRSTAAFAIASQQAREPARAVSHRRARRAAGVVARLSRRRARASSFLASVRIVSGTADHRGVDARSLRRRAPLARTARRRRHRLEPGVEDQRLGAPRATAIARIACSAICCGWWTIAPRVSAAASTRTCSTRIRRFRSTATSARCPASPKCCCRATPASCTCCRRCHPRGRPDASAACARAADSTSPWIGKKAG